MSFLHSIADCRLPVYRFSKDHLERPAMRSSAIYPADASAPIGNWQLAIGNSLIRTAALSGLTFVALRPGM